MCRVTRDGKESEVTFLEKASLKASFCFCERTVSTVAMPFRTVLLQHYTLLVSAETDLGVLHLPRLPKSTRWRHCRCCCGEC